MLMCSRKWVSQVGTRFVASLGMEQGQGETWPYRGCSIATPADTPIRRHGSSVAAASPRCDLVCNVFFTKTGVSPGAVDSFECLSLPGSGPHHRSAIYGSPTLNPQDRSGKWIDWHITAWKFAHLTFLVYGSLCPSGSPTCAVRSPRPGAIGYFETRSPT